MAMTEAIVPGRGPSEFSFEDDPQALYQAIADGSLSGEALREVIVLLEGAPDRATIEDTMASHLHPAA